MIRAYIDRKVQVEQMGRLDSKEKKEAELKQDLSQKAEPHHLYQMYLLFREKPKKPETETIRAALEKRFGDVDVVSADRKLTSFAIKKYTAVFEEGTMPGQVLMGEATELEQSRIGAMERTQFWDVSNGEELLNSCGYWVLLSDFMSSVMDYKPRCEMLTGWLEIGLELFPDCEAVWIPASGKLLTADQVRKNPQQGEGRFLYFALNARFFKIENTEDMIVDTLGLYALGLPDLQYHFHTLDPNLVVNHGYNAAIYIFENNAPIKSGETIDGLDDKGNMSWDVQWKCQYENALIQPARELMDICPGQYAAGGRHGD